MTEQVEKVALLPCPFCGGDAKLTGIRDGYQVTCQGKPRVPCFAQGPAVFGGPKGWEACKVDAIAAWNTRTPPDDSVARIVAIEGALRDYMSQFGQALEAHGIPYGPAQKQADDHARAILREKL